MMNYNKILEAISQGINLALDNFDNDIQQLSYGKIKSINVTENYLKIMEYFVDLGLPSGTLWCKYNLGCDHEFLSKEPENATPHDWYGNYYAWGELKPINGTHYKFKEYTEKYGIKYQHYTKYNMNDNITKLELCDDPAYNNNPYKNLNIDICVPTIQLYLELIENTTKSFFYDNNLFTCVLTSKINGNTISFPISGYISVKDSVTLQQMSPTYGYYMTSYIVPSSFEWLYYSFQIESNKLHIDTIAREHAVNVRPVLMK